MTDQIHIRQGHLRAIVAIAVLSLLGLIALAGYVYGEHRHISGYALGRDAERMKNPTQEYIESGLSFCWSTGNYYKVKPGRYGGFVVVK